MILLMLLACVGSAASPPESAPVVPVSAAVAPVVPLPTAPPLSQPVFTPRSVYQGCRDRVELPEAAGECVGDADCAPAGCAKEVCTTTTAATTVTTSCDVLDCFAVLDTCRCAAGTCTWDLRLPAGLLKPIPGLTPPR